MPPNDRIATLATLLGVGALVLIGVVSRPKRLFLYSYKSQDNGLSMAAVATIGPGYFRIEHTFPFGNWSTVASAARGGKNWLFLHNHNDGSAATGLIDQSFHFQPVKFYPPGTYSDWPYIYTVVNGRGDLLSIGSAGTSGAAVGFAQVLDDGTFVEWWRTVVPVPSPIYGTRWHGSIIGLPDSHAWLHRDQLGSTTVCIFDVKHAALLSTRRYEKDWDGIVADKGVVYLYDRFNKLAEVCVVDATHRLVTVKPAQLDIDLIRHTYEMVASARGAHLSYTYGTGAASVRILNKGGFPSTLQVDGLYGFWDFANEC